MNENGSRERLAWAFLLASFAIWAALVVAIPVAASAYIQRADRPLMLQVQANQGTVGLADGNGQSAAIFAGDPPRVLDGEAASLLTNTTDTALLNIFTPDEEQVLARVHIYANSNLDIEQATAPRFDLSNDEYLVDLNLNAGRVRLSLPARDGRALLVRMQTPQNGEILVQDAGQYSIESSNAETNVTVQEGTVLVSGGGERLAIRENERAVIPADGKLHGPLGSERDLIANGDFSAQLDGWTPLAWNVELGNQTDGETTIISSGGEDVLRFHRIGEGHADAVVLQEINQDVTDFEALELFATFRVVQQTLGVCGQQGSECPLFVRIEFEDVYGADRVWQQGFFANGTVDPQATPGVCQFCAPPINPHEPVPMNQVYFFESPNLLEWLAQQNMPPRLIKRVQLVASGHSFETQVIDVSLLARE
jgi:hypothetical protein